MHTSNRTGRLDTIPVMRDCPACPWQVVSDSAVLAEMEQATHRITDHATLPERIQIQNLVDSYRQIIGPLPGNLLILAVAQVLDTPTRAEVVSAA